MRKVVVTGASKGIGRAVALRFAQGGNAVAICARNEADLQETADLIRRKAPGAQVVALRCDVSKKENRKTFAEAVLAEWPEGADILVNNAGIFLPGQVHTEADGVLEQQIETNLYSAYHFTRLFVPAMMQRRSGHIFNMCSTASIMPYVNGGSYCISKFALHGMSQVLREEMKEYGVKVTAILPGATLTASWAGTDLPDSRFMKAEDVAETLWLAAGLSPSANIEEILLRPLLGDI